MWVTESHVGMIISWSQLMQGCVNSMNCLSGHCVTQIIYIHMGVSGQMRIVGSVSMLNIRIRIRLLKKLNPLRLQLRLTFVNVQGLKYWVQCYLMNQLDNSSVCVVKILIKNQKRIQNSNLIEYQYYKTSINAVRILLQFNLSQMLKLIAMEIHNGQQSRFRVKIQGIRFSM